MQLDIIDGRFRVTLTWWQRLLALRFAEPLEVSLAAIVEVKTERPPRALLLRAPGTSLPGVISAGTFYRGDEREFWYATRGGFLVLELRDHYFKRVVLTVEDNLGWAERIRAAR